MIFRDPSLPSSSTFVPCSALLRSFRNIIFVNSFLLLRAARLSALNGLIPLWLYLSVAVASISIGPSLFSCGSCCCCNDELKELVVVFVVELRLNSGVWKHRENRLLLVLSSLLDAGTVARLLLFWLVIARVARRFAVASFITLQHLVLVWAAESEMKEEEGLLFWMLLILSTESARGSRLNWFLKDCIFLPDPNSLIWIQYDLNSDPRRFEDFKKWIQVKYASRKPFKVYAISL